jgi:hypothetical protein
MTNQDETKLKMMSPTVKIKVNIPATTTFNHLSFDSQAAGVTMTVRLRGIVGIILAITLIFITVNTLVPSRRGNPEIKGGRNSRHVLDPARPNKEQTFSIIEHDTTDSEHKSTVASPSLVSPSADVPPHVAHDPAPLTPPQQPDDIRLLIGIMSPFWSSARRQIIRNAYSRFPKGLPVDVVFVEGNLTSDNERNHEKVLDMQRTAVSWENNTFHDIMHLNCTENLEYGKTYEYLKKAGLEFGNKYTHVMKTDDDSFVNIPGISLRFVNTALVEVLRANKDQEHFYWGTTWREPDRQHLEMWGSGYVLSMDLIKWISTSDIPPRNTWGYEDLQVAIWLIDGGLDDNFVVNRTAFAGYPWPDMGDYSYKQENDVRPFDRWTLVTHPLKEDFMWVDTAEYYVNLEW